MTNEQVTQQLFRQLRELADQQQRQFQLLARIADAQQTIILQMAQLARNHPGELEWTAQGAPEQAIEFTVQPAPEQSIEQRLAEGETPPAFWDSKDP